MKDQLFRFSINPDAVYTVINDEAVMMSEVDDELYGVNNVGTEILKHLESQAMSVQSISDYLTTQFVVDKNQAVIDTQVFLQSLLAENLIVQVE